MSRSSASSGIGLLKPASESAPRRSPRSIDVVSILMIYLAIRLLLPSQFVIGALGGAGSPALLVGLGCLLWWVLGRLQRTTRLRTSPLLGAVVLLIATVIASYLMATSRPINAEELSLSTLTILTMASWFGPMLLVNDGIADVNRLSTFLRFATALGGLLAAFGIFQFITGQYWTDHLVIPGLSTNTTIYGAQMREGFTRPAGTSIHPIEYGSVLTMLLPLALARGMGATDRDSSPKKNFVVRWWPAALISFAIMLSVSRSAIVGLAVGLIVVSLSWTAKQRIIALCAVVVLSTVVFLTIPGMLGTILGLFTNIGGDEGVASRTGSYAVAGVYIAQSPWFGRGIGTFLPTYRIFDNQYLLSIVEIGFVGVAALLILIMTALWCAFQAYRGSADPALKQMAAGVGASVATGAVCLALFDGFSFPMMPGLWFLLIGLCGACYRVTKLAPARLHGRGRLEDRVDLGDPL